MDARGNAAGQANCKARASCVANIVRGASRHIHVYTLGGGMDVRQRGN